MAVNTTVNVSTYCASVMRCWLSAPASTAPPIASAVFHNNLGGGCYMTDRKRAQVNFSKELKSTSQNSSSQ